jgi:hypothetical protein
LIAFWNEAQIGADVSRSADARRIVDCCDEGERGKLADTGDGHQPAAGCRGHCHARLMSASIAATALMTAVRAAISL